MRCISVLKYCIFAVGLVEVAQAFALVNLNPRRLEVHRNPVSGKCTYIDIDWTQYHKGLRYTDVVKEEGVPLIRHERRHGDESNSELQEYIVAYSFDLALLWEHATMICDSPSMWKQHQLMVGTNDMVENSQIVMSSGFPSKLPSSPPLEIIPLSKSGPSDNRVDITFFGDGYTKEEREKFFEDARILAEDISNNQTFATVKPLLNFWAAFSPSNETGIGVGGKPKDTVFGLYRDGTELRGVYYDKPEVALAACRHMGSACDYPILLGNDPLYGGLGGRLTVTTSSKLNGPLVLRHELGHSIIKEGEEYDGGFAYYGPNAAQNLSSPFPWTHWLTAHSSNAPPREERSVMPTQVYMWSMLAAGEPYVVPFNSSGQYSRFVVRFSLSGVPNADHLTVELDGEDLHWTPKPGIGEDRWHYDIHRSAPLKAGEHSVVFTLAKGALVGRAQLCSVEIIEFGDADEFNATADFIGAFPTFSETNETTYRPTNEGCLMRIVTTPNFCKVCTEGLWHVLLSRVRLIDSINVTCGIGELSQTRIGLDIVGLGQYRDSAGSSKLDSSSESIVISWKRDGVPLPQFTNSSEILVENGANGNYTADVEFVTDEVKVDPHGYLKDAAFVMVSETAGDRCVSDFGRI